MTQLSLHLLSASALVLSLFSSATHALPAGPERKLPVFVPDTSLLRRGQSDNEALGLPFFMPDEERLAQNNGTLTRRADGDLTTRIGADFPDPCIFKDHEGVWHAMSTSANGRRIQVATSKDPLGKWYLHKYDALPDVGWTSGSNYWAPDVRMIDEKNYIMYFSGENKEGGHCVGAARAEKPTGPYKIVGDKPHICPKDEGGAIDPAAFVDEDGKAYVVYKVDGNAKGVGSATPIRLQRVEVANGVKLIGDPVTILDKTKEDGPLVEAPSLVKIKNGPYVLFYSSNWYTGEDYDIKYAVSDKLTGPYVRAPAPLIKSPEMGLRGPGGASSNPEGNLMVFHSWCHEEGERKRRCMYSLPFKMA